MIPHQIRRQLAMLAAACAVSTASTSVTTQPALPTITLTPGERFFRVDGVPTVLLGTNPTGWTTAQFDTLLGWAGQHERVVRIHLSVGAPSGPVAPGQVDPAWATFWDNVLTTAELNGLYVLPVFAAWSPWSTSSPFGGGWAANPYNVVNGGTAIDPVELLWDPTTQQSSPTRTLWLSWLDALVRRWEGRPNILGWEIFSELNLITGATPPAATAFVEAAAAVIRAADTQGRPVTASLAGTIDWPDLSASSIDFLQVHPYAGYVAGQLDLHILNSVRTRLSQYGKPVFIGEGGLDTLLPFDPAGSLTLLPNAHIGINHAIWAGAVSGAMSARMLWFEDGYDQYHDDAAGNPLDLRTLYKDASAPVAATLQGMDFTAAFPTVMSTSNDLIGAAIASTTSALAWVRDVQSIPNNWPVRLLSGQSVSVGVPGTSADWLVTLHDTTTGAALQSNFYPNVGGFISVALPDFVDSIAIRIEAGIEIDIRPNQATNLIDPASSGPLAIAILTTSVGVGDGMDFDASTVDPASIRFGPGAAVAQQSIPADVDSDGDLDLVIRVRNLDTGLTCGQTSASLTGTTFTGRSLAGTDAVTIVGCP